MSLSRVQEQWLYKWDELNKTVKWPHITLAAPFFSVGSYPTPTSSKRTILMVGKATHKDWYMNLFKKTKKRPVSERTEERKDATLDFLEHHASKHRSSYWALYRSLVRVTGANVVWTNLAKIGVCRPREENPSINPWGPFLNPQADLAQKTLYAEIDEYRPDLVLLVTGDYALTENAAPVFCPDGKWRREIHADGSYYVLEPRAGRPPVLRTGHPGYKTRAERDSWIKAAQQMLSAD